MADVKHGVVCFGFDVSQLIVYTGCSLVTSKFPGHVKDQMIQWPCSTWVSEQEIFPIHGCASTSQHKCKKVRDCSFPQLPRTESGKDTERKRDHSLNPPDRAHRVPEEEWNRQLSLCEQGARVLRLGYTTELMNCLVLTEGEVPQLAQADPRSCWKECF